MLSNVEGDRTDGGVPRYIFANVEQNLDAAQSRGGPGDERQNARNRLSADSGKANDSGRQEEGRESTCKRLTYEASMNDIVQLEST